MVDLTTNLLYTSEEISRGGLKLGTKVSGSWGMTLATCYSSSPLSSMVFSVYHQRLSLEFLF